MRQMFATKTALDGGVVRRKVSDVERLVGREAFFGAMKKRGFRVVENAGHFVVFCNSTICIFSSDVTGPKFLDHETCQNPSLRILVRLA